MESGEDVAYANTVVALNGGMRVLPGGRLTLDNVTLVANASDLTITVSAGAFLEIRNYSTVDAGPLSGLQPGGDVALAFSLRVEPGATLVVDRSEVRHFGRTTGALGDTGLYLGGANATLRDSILADGLNGLVLDNATEVLAVNVSVQRSRGADLLLVANSSLAFIGGMFATANVSNDSVVDRYYLVDVEVDDTAGRPMHGADYRVFGLGGIAASTGGFGGSTPRTAVDRLYHHVPRWIPVLTGLVDRGGPSPAFPVTVEARYAQWAENRTQTISVNTHLTFVKHLETVTFTDVSDAAGVSDPTHVFTENTRGPGAAWGDFDRDGWPDLYVAGSSTMNGGFFSPDSDKRRAANHLYRNNGDDTFADVTDAAGVGYEGSIGVTFVDYDNDGWPDLYLANYGWGGTLDSPGEANILYRNNGNGTFTDVTAMAGVGDSGHSVGSAWGDYDRDGYLDLYAVNQGILVYPTIRNETNTLYHNNGDGTFTNVTGVAGYPVGGAFDGWGLGRPQALIPNFVPDTAGNLSLDGANGSGMSFAAIWFDYDNDGWPDLLVGNDFGVSPLYRNNRDGTFTDVTARAGLQLVGSSMGFDAHDIDGNGWLDIYQTNYSENYLWMNYNGTFIEEARARGVDDEMVGWGTDFGDFDNDGNFDLLVANGRVSFSKPLSLEILYRNDGTGHFADVAADAGLGGPAFARKTQGLAVADFNRDGCLDFYLGNSDGANQLLRNDCGGGSWLEIELVGTVSNRDGTGARAHVWGAGGFHAWDEAIGGASFASGNSNILHFGLGARQMAANVTVVWPSGREQSETNVSANQTLRFVEPVVVTLSTGGNRTVPEDLAATFTVQVMACEDPDFARNARYEWTFTSGPANFAAVGRTASASFSDPGQWLVELTATDPSTGVTAKAGAVVTVADRTAPAVEILSPAPGVRIESHGPVAVNLTGRATDNDASPGASLTFVWRITGPESFDAQLPGANAHATLPGPGSYTLRLTVTDRSGNSNESQVNLTVVAPPPGSPGSGAWVWYAAAAVSLAVIVGGLIRFRRVRGK